MKLITRFELARQSNAALSQLERRLREVLGDPMLDDAHRRTLLASLENIARERASRAFRPRGL